jgi:hypothetical protein
MNLMLAIPPLDRVDFAVDNYARTRDHPEAPAQPTPGLHPFPDSGGQPVTVERALVIILLVLLIVWLATRVL